jgi:hypothetical protein
MAFIDAWRAFWAGREEPKTKTEFIRGEKRYSALDEKCDLSGLVAYLRDADVT